VTKEVEGGSVATSRGGKLGVTEAIAVVAHSGASGSYASLD